nr:bifunctional NAD(P)H-hydrate repair enzyme Nnr-like [Nerophis lumbriciformis]
MSTLLTRSQMQALDRLAIDDVGLPSLVLMEVAGRALADAVYERYVEEPGLVIAVAGSGNNGGDAAVAARHLAERGVPVELVVLAEPTKLSADLTTNLEIAARLGLDATYLVGDVVASRMRALVERSTYAIDGILGTGLSRPVEGSLADAIAALAFDDLFVVAADIPSGIDADTGQVLGVAVEADLTVTFQFAKLGHVLYPGRSYAGETRVVDIGIPTSRVADVEPWAEIVDDAEIDLAVPLRAPDTHKGTYGHLLVVAGTPDRPGSSLLAGRAGLSVGTGLVTIASDPRTIERIAGSLDGLMAQSLASTADAVAALDARTALVIGPSLPAKEATAKLVRVLLEASRVPVVLDAGALTALGSDLTFLKDRSGPVILTPHPGEMGRLTGLDTAAVQERRVSVARALAEETQTIVVLKGASTVVASPDGQVGVVVRGNAGMATGGMGDVLSGLIGGLLAQGVHPELAARAGAQLHALAGDEAAVKYGEPALQPMHVIDAVGGVLLERHGGRG